jgi:RNA polymerase sigma factor (sigma-70 family)
MSHSEAQVPVLKGWAVTRRKEASPKARRKAVRVAPLGAGATEDECQEMLLDHLDFIDRMVAAIARRQALSDWEADDLGGQVKLRLLSNDYAILRRFQGKSRLTTYLTTVIHNLFRDYRIQQWGKWRSSAAAKRHGDVGVQLEALLYRDRFGFDEAVEILRTRYSVEGSLAELLEIAATIRPRTNRRFESDTVLSRLEAAERGDQRVVDRDLAELQARMKDAMSSALAALEPEDRLILRLRFADGLTIRAIAATLDLDQRRIYARVERVLNQVREDIFKTGLRSEEILDLLDWPACAVEVGLTDAFPLLSEEIA